MSTLTRARDAALRMVDVARVVPFKLVRDGEPGTREGDGLTLDGYASVFNSLTIIDSWEGRFKEQFLPGSMKRSFREQTPIIQFDHGRHPMIGSLPVAAFEKGYPVEESDPERAPDGGAHVLARMHQAPLFEPVREVISTGTVNGMSIRFGVAREKWYRPDGTEVKDGKEIEQELLRTWLEDVPDEELLRRDIIEARVAEMGPVVWPAYTSTSVGVRSLFDGMTGEQRRQFAGEVAAEMQRQQRQNGEQILIDAHIDGHELVQRLRRTPDLIAAPGARSAGGEESDAERPSADASRTTPSRRQRADSDALRLRGIALEGKAVQR